MTRTERQLLAIDKWRDCGGRASVVMATGVGKTRTAIMAIERVTTRNPNLIIRVIVPTRVLKKQWEDIIDEQQWSLDIEVLVANTASRKPFKCDFLVMDEAHRYAAEQLSKVFSNCAPALILGLTATYERLDGREKLILDKYCPVCDTVTIEEATANGWLAPYTEYKVYIDVDLTEYQKANAEFMQHFAFFDYDFKLAMDCVTNVFAQQALAKQMNCKLSEVKAHTYAWNRALQFRKSFVANHPRKIEVAKQIIAARPDKKIITFNTSIEQCNAYGFGYVVHSKKSKKENEEILEEFSRCKTGCLHNSKILMEGLDCPGLSVAIVTGFTSSKTNKIQTIGRTIRFEPNKKAEIFTLVLRNTVEEQWYKKASETKNFIEINEQELNMVLNSETLKNKKVKTQEKVNNDLLRM